ncbi:hypothetical protein [Taibaiella koreensis]|uniref:hypothetical protein n=1 Tax=Taibaiella koreensis TaxID=1268548 RepID=UPI000E59B6FF|nr:hypothetical protein [Taibaiella koreensis]
MSINKSNIADFITFLYRKRKGQDPPARLKEGWTALSNEEIADQLSGLFHSWGLTDEDKRNEINAFFKETLFTPRPQPAPKVIPVPVSAPADVPVTPWPAPKRRKKWPFIVLPLLLLLLGYLGYQYLAYSSMQYLYTITDNVLVRDENKEAVARMDLYEVKGPIPSFQKLKAVDKEIYYRSIDNTSNQYPFRKVLLKDNGFLSYLFKGKKDIGYVNTNYVVENVKEFDLYQTAFKEVKNNRAENADLKAIYRKIIIGSMSQDGDLESKYIALHTSGIPRSAADATYAIIKQPIKENVQYVIVAGLSDGFYYRFAGDIKNNDYTAPEKIMVTMEDKTEKPLNGAYRFMNRDGKIILYDCVTNTPTYYEAKKDANGNISAFVYNAPSLLEQILPPDQPDTAQ